MLARRVRSSSSRPSLPLVTGAFAAAVSLVGVSGQSREPGPSGPPDSAVAIVEALVKGEAEATPAAYLGSLEKLIEAATDDDWKRDLKTAVGVVRDVQTWAEVAQEEADRLFETVGRYRSHPVRMAPLVMMLRQVAPDRPDVRFAVLDTFALPSRIRDVGTAARAAQFLLDNDWDDESAASLASIWRYAGCAHDIVAGAQSAAELVRYLHVVRSLLSGSQPIRQLTPAERARLRRLDRLREARLRGEYDESVKLLESFRKAEPDQPGFALLLGQTYASLDPKLKCKAPKAKQCLKAFLAATEADPAKWPSGEMQWLLGFLGAEQRSLDGLRRRAKALRKNMSSARPERQLISPDRDALGKRIKSLRKQVERAASALGAQQELVDTAASRVSAAEARLRDAKRRARGDRRFSARVANAAERLSDAKTALTKSKRRRDKKRASHADVRGLLDACEARMARFVDPDR